MSELVKLEIKDQIAHITLQNGKVNAVSHEVLDELNAALDKAEAEKAIVILSGQPGIFSGGYDLKTMRAGLESAIGLVTRGSELSVRMLSFPTPIISACTGHAVAKGSFLLLCSDYRIGIEGDFKLGLNEVAIGITMHHAGIEMARRRMPAAYFNRSVVTAEMFDPNGAVDAGILDRVVPAESLMETAMAVAEGYKKIDMGAHHRTKLKVRADYLAAMEKAIELDKKGSL
jgi:enoyl-CoA hydratase